MSSDALIYGFNFAHHGKHSAFNAFAAAMADQDVVDITPTWISLVPERFRNRVRDRWLVANEYRLRSVFRTAEPRVIHYYHPENTLRRAGAWKGPHRLLATCHQPIEQLQSWTDHPVFSQYLHALQACDAIVVYGRQDAEAYRAMFPAVPVHFLHHGIDTGFFDPGQREAPATHTILTVGNWLRDYACWAGTVKLLLARHKDLRFEVIANRDILNEARGHLGGDHAQVAFRQGLDDEELKGAYRNASLLFLPLEGAMANNAVLESLSMAVPIVATDFPAVRDYTGDGPALFVKGNDPATFAATIESLLRDPVRRAAMSAAGRARAVADLDWRAVADAYRAIYRNLLGRTARAT